MLRRLLRRNAPTLRIVTWNCQMAFRNKYQQLATLKPDIAVIQECERPAKWPAIGATSCHWHGDNQHKGLAVLSFGAWRLEPVAQGDPSIEYVLPAQVTGPRPFNLLGVWTKASKTHGQSYVGQLTRACAVYGDWLASSDAAVIGDWNSNERFDRAADQGPHKDVVGQLKRLGLVSAYHQHFKTPLGQETHMTWYNHKDVNRGFHIDYCFIPAAWALDLRAVTVGEFAAWRPYSDHCPLLVDVWL